MSEIIKPTDEKIAIVGLGYVGLPLALLFVSSGFTVIGIDRDVNKLTSLKSSKSYLEDVKDEEIKQAVESGKFAFTNDYTEVKNVDACIICLPTPLNDDHTPNLNYIIDGLHSVVDFLHEGQLVIIESSTFPGTTDEILCPILEKNGRKVGVDFHLAYSPERIDPGNKEYHLKEIPKVVSGVTTKCKEKITALYGNVFNQVVIVSSTKAAEMTKILENSYRFVNISFINEIAINCHHMEIDVWEVINAAATKPFGFVPYYPGPGIGGHCIPVDPLYLLWRAKHYNSEVKMIETAKEINDNMPDYIVSRLQKFMEKNNKKLQDSSILLVGMSYKKDVGDLRESVSLKVLEKLLNKEVNVSIHDSLVQSFTLNEKMFTSLPLTPETIENHDCTIILTNHSYIPYEMIVKYAPLVFDTRHQITGNPSNIEKL